VPRTNRELAAAFRELADLMEITGAERFRILAYRRAAETISRLGVDVGTLSDKELTSLRGVGVATAKKIREFLETGRMEKLDELRLVVPAGVRELTSLAGLGPKKAMLLHAELGISTLDDLREAIEKQRVRAVRGLGTKTEENLQKALAQYSVEERRILLGVALRTAEEIVAALSEFKAIKRVSYAGSLRRMRETIGDIDLLAASPDPPKVMDAFTSLSGMLRVIARGPTKSSVVTREGIQVDLRVVAPDEFGAALQYFTGSKEHNVKVREHAVKMGLKLSEYGLFKVGSGERIAAQTEEEVYGALGMQTPPPTMREDRGEVELALSGELPSPIELRDIKGDLQGHSRYSDGRETIADMARAAAEVGYKYWAVTDHGQQLAVVNHLTSDDIDRQAAEVAEVNRSLAGKITVLHGVELNISPSGELDYPDEVLRKFDVVVASVHSPPWDRDGMTRRIIRAIENPNVHIIGHPTGRRIGKRAGGEFDLVKVFKAAVSCGVAMEVNSNQERLDLRDDHVRIARELGCLFAIDTDAHRFSELDFMRLGVYTAQRGWVTKESVINAWPLSKLRRFLDKDRSSALR
jgi:DNA polymerase (family 10)